MIVTVANRKGGVGKTTTSMFLAHALARATGDACTIVDADPQQSSRSWALRAAGAGHPLPVRVVTRGALRAAEIATPHAVIDTAPTVDETVTAALHLADLVLVPTTPSSLDLSCVQATLEAARRAQTPAYVLLTRTRRTLSLGAAEESLRAEGAEVLDTHIPLREALAMAFGQPVRDLHGYDLATAEVLGALPEQPFSLAAVRARAVADGWARLDGPGRFGQHRWTPPAAAPPAPPAPPPVPATAPEWDDDVVARLKTSVARLATQRS